jgi:hypothetical protein
VKTIFADVPAGFHARAGRGNLIERNVETITGLMRPAATGGPPV